jgi:hypothetical protein
MESVLQGGKLIVTSRVYKQPVNVACFSAVNQLQVRHTLVYYVNDGYTEFVTADGVFELVDGKILKVLTE